MKPFFIPLLSALSLSPATPGTIEFEPPTGHWSYNPNTNTYTAGDGLTKIPNNNLLATTTEYRDFLFACEFQITGNPETGIINSGIQFHAQRLPDHHEMIGYQAHIGAPGNPKWWGCLYDESRRNTILAAPEAPLKTIANAKWHTYHIRAQSGRIQLTIDNLPAANYTELDPEIPLQGHLALQIHSGGATQIRFRHPRIETLGPNPEILANLRRLLASGKTATSKAITDTHRFHLTSLEPELISLLNDHHTPKKLLIPTLHALTSFPSQAEDTFATLAADPSTSPEARQAAIQALHAIGTDSAKSRIKAITTTD